MKPLIRLLVVKLKNESLFHPKYFAHLVLWSYLRAGQASPQAAVDEAETTELTSGQLRARFWWLWGEDLRRMANETTKRVKKEDEFVPKACLFIFHFSFYQWGFTVGTLFYPQPDSLLRPFQMNTRWSISHRHSPQRIWWVLRIWNATLQSLLRLLEEPSETNLFGQTKPHQSLEHQAKPLKNSYVLVQGAVGQRSAASQGSIGNGFSA